MRRRSCDPYSDRAAGPEMTLTLHRQVKQTGRVSRLQARLFSGFRASVGVTLPRHGGNEPGDRGSNRALPHPAEARLPGHV